MAAIAVASWHNQFAFQIRVKPVGHFVAPIRIADRVNQHDQFLANLADHRLFGHRKPVR